MLEDSRAAGSGISLLWVASSGALGVVIGVAGLSRLLDSRAILADPLSVGGAVVGVRLPGRNGQQTDVRYAVDG